MKTTCTEQIYHSVDRDRHFDAMANLSMLEAGTQRAKEWLREAGLVGRAVIGVVGVMNDSNTRLDAWAKVIVPGKGSFEHRELYITFPSDHFKTKVLLACG